MGDIWRSRLLVKTWVIYLISQGPGESQHCVEQTLAPQADVLTPVHLFLLKHRCDALVT